MLTREQNRADRREVLIQIAESGKAELGAAERQALGGIVDVLERLGEEDGKAWFDIQNRIIQVLGGDRAGESSSERVSGEVNV